VLKNGKKNEKQKITNKNINMYPKKITKKKRIKLYKIAHKHFKKNEKIENSINKIPGMCLSIYYAIRVLNNKGYEWIDINKENLPEFYAFKPKTKWKKDKIYWFSYYKNQKAYEIRESILAALAAEKTPEQWKKEWKELERK